MKDENNHQVRPRWLGWLWCALPAVIAVVLFFLLPHLPFVAEWVFARGLFRAIAFPVEFLMSLLPFSLTEVAVVLGIPAAVVLLIVWVVRLLRRGPHRRRLLKRGLRLLAWSVSLAMLVFMIMCGANFSRYSVTELMALPERAYTVEELTAVTADLAQKASAAREQITEDEDGCMTLSMSLSNTLRQADDGYRRLQAQYPFLRPATWQVKPVALSHLWSYTGYTGVYCPWLGEASVNVDITSSELGHTAAHEMAHTIGFAKEDECNFLGYLACINSGHPDYVYSGYLAALIYCSNALGRNDAAARKEAYGHCSAGVLRDLRQRNAYWEQFEGQTMEVSQQVNDTFIKVNGDPSGTASYGQAVKLILQYYDKQGWL